MYIDAYKYAHPYTRSSTQLVRKGGGVRKSTQFTPCQNMAYNSKFVSIYLQRDAMQESREVKSYFIKGVAGERRGGGLILPGISITRRRSLMQNNL